jgi:phage-related protein
MGNLMDLFIIAGPNGAGKTTFARKFLPNYADCKNFVLGSGVFEIALPFKSDAFRVVYAVQLADDIWVVHAFQKKSTQGVKTPKHEIDLIKDRLKRLKEMLR